MTAAVADRVRDHPAFPLAETVGLVTAMGASILAPNVLGVVPLALLALGLVAVAVEAYNYWTGASVPRVEF